MANTNAAITKKQRGSFDPRVILSDNRNVSLVDLMIESYNQSGDVAGVKENISLGYTRSFTNATGSFLYSTVTTPTALVRVPTLTELGYSETGYKLEVTATAYLRTPAPDQSVEARLVDSSGNEIAGSLAAGTVISNVFDTPIKTTKTEVAGGTACCFDFRRTSGADDSLLYHFSLLIQVVKV